MIFTSYNVHIILPSIPRWFISLSLIWYTLGWNHGQCFWAKWLLLINRLPYIFYEHCTLYSLQYKTFMSYLKIWKFDVEYNSIFCMQAFSFSLSTFFLHVLIYFIYLRIIYITMLNINENQRLNSKWKLFSQKDLLQLWYNI